MPHRILLATVLGKFVDRQVRAAFPADAVYVADSPQAIQHAAATRQRFDVVVTDIVWRRDGIATGFDGLDVLAALRRADSQVRIILVAYGADGERDYIDEALGEPQVAGIFPMVLGPSALVRAVTIAASGGRLAEPDFPSCASPPGVPRIHEYLHGRRSMTAAKVVWAIASGRAASYHTLVQATGIPKNTVQKVMGQLGPLIVARGELAAGLSMTSEVLYRWCGEHAGYILSWCRRNKLDLR